MSQASHIGASQEGAPKRPPASRPAMKTAASRLLIAVAVFFAVFEAISIHSALNGNPSKGAFQGVFVLAAIGAVVAWRMSPAADRHRALARAALVTSVLAIVCVLALCGKIAEATGALPPGVPVAQSILLLLFQTGWAFTYWLTEERGLRETSRYIPAAAGGVLLIVGGFMVGGGAQAGRPAATEAATGKFVTFPKPEDFAFARETARAGAAENGADFANYHTGELPLLGITVNTREWMRRTRIDRDLRGIFDPDAVPEGEFVLLAKPGFAVAGVEIQGGESIDALRVEFGPLDGSRVSLVDRYWSDWVGSRQWSEETTRLDGDSELVVGIAGSRGLTLNSLSLLVAE